MSSRPRTISLTVPENAEVGDSLTFAVDGKELEIPVPEGSRPGDVLEIQIGGSTNGDTGSEKESEDQEDGYTIELSNGKTLTFATCCPSKHQQQREDPCTKATSSGFSNENIDDGTHNHPWPAGMEMARFLGAPKAKQVLNKILNVEHEKSLKVLELGSGLGLVGLSFAAQHRAKESMKIVLSDIASGIPRLKHNIQQNASCSQSNYPIEARPLVWKTSQENPNTPSTSPDSQQKHKFHLILASDVLYNSTNIPSLVSTIKWHLEESEKSAVLLAARWRKPELERSFFEQLQGWQGKTWDLIHADKCHLSWRQYGDPDNDASNLYFHQTMISVQGKPQALAGLLAEQQDHQALTERMTDDEARAFEQCQIQMHCLSNVDLSRWTGEDDGIVSTTSTSSKESKESPSPSISRKRDRETDC